MIVFLVCMSIAICRSYSFWKATLLQDLGQALNDPDQKILPSDRAEILGTCFDGIKNQDEEEVDCGGEYCWPCMMFKDGKGNEWKQKMQ